MGFDDWKKLGFWLGTFGRFPLDFLAIGGLRGAADEVGFCLLS